MEEASSTEIALSAILIKSDSMHAVGQGFRDNNRTLYPLLRGGMTSFSSRVSDFTVSSR